MSVLGIDLGKTWGWATFDGTEPEIRFGEESAGNDALVNSSAGMIYHTFQRWLWAKLTTYRPSLVVYESVRFTRGMSYIEGQKGVLLAALEDRSIEYYGLPIGTLKKWGAGTGKATKAQVMEAVKDRWTDPDGFGQSRPWDNRTKLTDNIADALWCAHHGWTGRYGRHEE
jgi:Holliday junction resolvasome RuvABC endonuclease subunit